MTINEQIRDAVYTSNNIHVLCDRLKDICDTNNDLCPAKILLHNIRHLSITKTNINHINILEDSKGSFKIIRSDSNKELINEGYRIHTLTLTF